MSNVSRILDAPASISVVIPTYGRDEVLVNTISALLTQEYRAAEILVIDQTEAHDEAARQQLQQWDSGGEIRWIHQQPPSIPKAMNAGLLHARGELVLFLDDDIIPANDLIQSHASNFEDEGVWAVVGQVLQPGQEPRNLDAYKVTDGIRQDLRWPFNSSTRREVRNCMAGNLSVRRERALEAGGFDENFIGAAYRFETEFARRLTRDGGRIVFDPRASIRHLRAARGGTRSYGNFLATISPAHSVGEYYFALRHGFCLDSFRYIAHRLVRSSITRYHVKHPWHIPTKIIGEVRGLWLAIRFARRGPKLLATKNAPQPVNAGGTR